MKPRIVPAALHAARLSPCMRVLDIGTDLAVGFAGLAGVVAYR
jgi:hypothetical protein